MHLRIKKSGGNENEVEIWEWSIRLRFEVEEMMNTFEGDEIMMKKPKVIQVEVDDNWKQRNVKLKFERWSVKMKFEDWRNYGWRELKLINLEMKKFEGSESWICWCLKLKTVKTQSKLFKVIENQRWWNMKLKRSKV